MSIRFRSRPMWMMSWIVSSCSWMFVIVSPRMGRVRVWKGCVGLYEVVLGGGDFGLCWGVWVDV